MSPSRPVSTSEHLRRAHAKPGARSPHEKPDMCPPAGDTFSARRGLECNPKKLMENHSAVFLPLKQLFLPPKTAKTDYNGTRVHVCTRGFKHLKPAQPFWGIFNKGLTWQGTHSRQDAGWNATPRSSWRTMLRLTGSRPEIPNSKL